MEDWEKKYFGKRAQQLQQQQQQQQGNRPNFGNRPNGPMPQSQDWDITDALKQRIMSNAVSSQGGGDNGKTADLVEGFPYYTILQSEAFGHTVRLFRTAGTISGPTSKNVVVKGETRGYLVDNLSSVDMSKINENPERMVVLVEVTVPLVGTFLVPKESVRYRNAGPLGDGRTLLKG